jgi:hypothetical protein
MELALLNQKYMQTVSVIAIGSVALAAAAANQAHAQDDGFSLTFQGGIGDLSGGFQSGGGTDGQTPDLGQFGAITLSRSYGSVDASMSLSYYNQASKEFGSGYSSGFSSGGTDYQDTGQAFSGNDTSYSTLDLTVAMRSAASPRLQWLAGMRFMDYSHAGYLGFEGTMTNVSGGGSGPSGGPPVGPYGVTYRAQTEFVGIGPRFGARYSTGRIGSSNFGLTGEAGASLMYGRVEEGINVSFFSGGGTTGSFGSGFSEMKFVSNVDLSLQANYYLSDASRMFIAWESQQMLNLSDVGFGSDARTQTISLGFTTEF